MWQEEVLCGWVRVWRQYTTEVWVCWVQAVTRLRGETQATSTGSEQGDPEHCRRSNGFTIGFYNHGEDRLQHYSVQPQPGQV